MYLKLLRYNGKEWVTPVPITVPEVTISTANTDTTIFTPKNGFSVLSITIDNPTAAAVSVTLKDGQTTIRTLSVSAGGSVSLSNIVIKNSLVVSASAAGVKVFVVGEDWQTLII